MLVHHRVTWARIKVTHTPLYTWVERIAQSGVQHTIHEATVSSDSEIEQQCITGK